MIELINVSKWYPTDFGRHYVFRDVNLKLPPDKSVGVIGPNGAGKSTLLRILAGADTPNDGKVIRTGLISPPMGLTPSLLASLTGSENARFACRIYGMDRDDMDETVESVGRLANIGKYYNMPVSTYSAGMKQRVAFAINMAMHYDYYLFDEIGAGGDREFRQIANRLIEERLASSQFIITSHRVDELVELCEACIVIRNAELRYFDDIKDGLEFYGETVDIGQIQRKIERKARRKERDGDPAGSKEERRARRAPRMPDAVMENSGSAVKAAVDPSADSKEARKAEKLNKKAQKAARASALPGADAGTQDKAMRRARRAPRAPVISPSVADGGAAMKTALTAASLPPQMRAREPLPMAPRIPKAKDGDQKLEDLRQRLSQRDETVSIEPALTEPPAGNRDERKQLREMRRQAAAAAEQLSVGPTGGSSATPVPEEFAGVVAAQVKAAAKAAKAMVLLQQLLGEDALALPPDDKAKALKMTTEAQLSAARASERAQRLMTERVSEPQVHVSPVMAEAPHDDAQAGMSRDERKAARRLRRQQSVADAATPQTLSGSPNS